MRRGSNPGPVFVEVSSGTVRPIPGLLEQDRPLAWSADGQALFVREFTGVNPALPAEAAVRIASYDIRTGRKTPWKELRCPTGGPGVARIIHDPVLSADGRACFYTLLRYSNHLYLVVGLK